MRHDEPCSLASKARAADGAAARSAAARKTRSRRARHSGGSRKPRPGHGSSRQRTLPPRVEDEDAGLSAEPYTDVHAMAAGRRPCSQGWYTHARKVADGSRWASHPNCNRPCFWCHSARPNARTCMADAKFSQTCGPRKEKCSAMPSSTIVRHYVQGRDLQRSRQSNRRSHTMIGHGRWIKIRESPTQTNIPHEVPLHTCLLYWSSLALAAAARPAAICAQHAALSAGYEHKRPSTATH